MIKKTIGIIFTTVCILGLVALSGCSKNEVATTDNENQTATTVSDNANTAVNPATTPPPNMDNTAANPPNNMTPGVETLPMSEEDKKLAAKDKKSSSPKKIPTPEIGSGANDMFIFTQINGKLSSDKELVNTVTAEIKEGIVTLTGKVANEDQKKKAEQLVREVQGVKGVKNNLRVS
ncbi:MAG: BON domain-containing protein [Aridibacter sp.]